uniref:Uncharacterized protein n=1 Tax=viral metagenome TaxID=1070528 RepID=A0A6M3J7H8_9ZZZZ
MQITVKSVKTLKTGTNDYGPWALVKVVTDKDVEYTTLAKEAGTIIAGMVIDIDELSITTDEKTGKEKRGFKKFEIVSESSAPAPALSAAAPSDKGMTPGMWAEKDRAQAHSIETQVAFKGIMELATACIEKESNISGMVKFLPVYDAALDWAMAHLQTTKPPQQPTPKPASKPAQSISSPVKAETKPEIQEEQGEAPYDMKGLQSDLETLESKGLKAWTRANVLSYLNVCSGKKHTKISEAFTDLSDNQKQEFLIKVAEAIELV